MRPDLLAIALRHEGLVTRRDAVGAGYTERELKTLTGHRGDWVVVRRGCYVERDTWSRLDADGHYRLQVLAVAMTSTRDAVVSHASAACLHGLHLRPHWRELVHVTRPGVTGSRTENGVKHHRAGLGALDVVHSAGLRLTSPARTAVDIAREHGYVDGVLAADQVLAAGTPREELALVLEAIVSWPHVTWARAAVAAADGGAQSPGETHLRLLVLELGLGPVETQFVVREGRRWAVADLRVGRHLFEFDGRVKYLGRERGGVADRPIEDVLWDEKQREDWLRRADGGYGMSRVTWSELFGDHRSRTRGRLHAEYQQTVARFGDRGA